MDAQLKKGIVEVCVLVALQERDSYGYQIIKDVSPIVEISYSMEHNSRLRKYYRLTEVGRQRIRDFLVEWQDVMRAYRYIAGSQTQGPAQNLEREGRV